MKTKFKLSLFILVSLAIVPSYAFAHGLHKEGISDNYNSQIISNGEFKAKSVMSQTQIQDFLASKGSALASYTFVLPDNGSSPWIGPGDSVDARGMTAAQLIYSAAQWYDINPQVILATLQKESSIITSGNLNYLNTAMGYGCPEGGSCSVTYANFARQVDWGTWQFDYNYRYSELNDAGRVGQYRAGNTATLDGKSTYITNSATASLYRYTPHRPDSAYLTATDGNHYYGNYNFIYFYSQWFIPYAYEFVSAINPPANLPVGYQATAQIVLRNKGSATWQSDAADPVTPFRLAVFSGASDFYDPSWIEPTRIQMTTASAAYNETATFTFTVKAGSNPGYRVMRFVPVEENVTALKDAGMQLATSIPAWYSYEFVSAINPPANLPVGYQATAQIVLRNKGSATWQSDAADPVTPFRLAVFSGASDFYDPSWIEPTRIQMTTASAGHNQLATFTFTVKAGPNPGFRAMRFVPVEENVTALTDIGMQFATNIPAWYAYEFISASNPPTALNSGQQAAVQVVLRNKGSAVWQADSGDPVTPFRLAIFSGAPDFYDLSWVEPSRVQMNTASVGHNGEGIFTFIIKAGPNKGYKTMRFVPVEENVTAFTDIGMQFGMTIN